MSKPPKSTQPEPSLTEIIASSLDEGVQQGKIAQQAGLTFEYSKAAKHYKAAAYALKPILTPATKAQISPEQYELVRKKHDHFITQYNLLVRKAKEPLRQKKRDEQAQVRHDFVVQKWKDQNQVGGVDLPNEILRRGVQIKKEMYKSLMNLRLKLDDLKLRLSREESIVIDSPGQNADITNDIEDIPEADIDYSYIPTNSELEDLAEEIVNEVSELFPTELDQMSFLKKCLNHDPVHYQIKKVLDEATDILKTLRKANTAKKAGSKGLQDMEDEDII